MQMHNKITENPWKAEEKTDKVERGRIHVYDTSLTYLEKNWVGTEGGPPYPHNERGGAMFLVLTDVSGAIENYLFTLSTEKKTMQFYVRQGAVFTSQLCKKKDFKNWSIASLEII